MGRENRGDFLVDTIVPSLPHRRTAAGKHGPFIDLKRKLQPDTGIEPVTSSLRGCHSTI